MLTFHDYVLQLTGLDTDKMTHAEKLQYVDLYNEFEQLVAEAEYFADGE